MKASKFLDAQKAFILKQGDDGVPVAEICRTAGISQATYFNWRKKHAGLLPDEMRRLKALEDENSKLKKIVADLTLDREMLQDVLLCRRRSVAECEAVGEAVSDALLSFTDGDYRFPPEALGITDHGEAGDIHRMRRQYRMFRWGWR